MTFDEEGFDDEPTKKDLSKFDFSSKEEDF